MWLCNKQKRKWAFRPTVSLPTGAPPQVELDIFAPASAQEVAAGTVSQARATCLCCGTVLPPARVRSQLAAQRGGADAVFDDDRNRTGGARITAVVTLKPGQPGRHYRLPNDSDYAAVSLAQTRIASSLAEWEKNGNQAYVQYLMNPLTPFVLA